MNHVSVFFNNRICESSDVDLLTSRLVDVGNWLLTPARCLFNGNVITIAFSQGQLSKIDDKNEFTMAKRELGLFDSRPQRDWLNIACSIIALIPSIILGGFIKALGYFHQSVRDSHSLAVKHYTPIDRKVGDENSRLNVADIKLLLQQMAQENKAAQQTDNLIVYAEPGTKIGVDIGFLALVPKRIILDGAKLVHENSLSAYCLDEYLMKAGWKGSDIRNVSQDVDSTFVTQERVNTLADALLGPEKTVYLIN